MSRLDCGRLRVSLRWHWLGFKKSYTITTYNKNDAKGRKDYGWRNNVYFTGNRRWGWRRLTGNVEENYDEFGEDWKYCIIDNLKYENIIIILTMTLMTTMNSVTKLIVLNGRAWRVASMQFQENRTQPWRWESEPIIWLNRHHRQRLFCAIYNDFPTCKNNFPKWFTIRKLNLPK